MSRAGCGTKGGGDLRYRYIAYKYTRKIRPNAGFQSIWDSFGAWAVPSVTVWRPPTDVYETPDELVVVMELAGVSEENLSVTLFSDLLVVEGERQHPVRSNAALSACHQLGIKYGEFRSEVYVPTPVNHDHVTAEYKNGLLSITLKKTG